MGSRTDTAYESSPYSWRVARLSAARIVSLTGGLAIGLQVAPQIEDWSGWKPPACQVLGCLPGAVSQACPGTGEIFSSGISVGLYPLKEGDSPAQLIFTHAGN